MNTFFFETSHIVARCVNPHTLANSFEGDQYVQQKFLVAGALSLSALVGLVPAAKADSPYRYPSRYDDHRYDDRRYDDRRYDDRHYDDRRYDDRRVVQYDFHYDDRRYDDRYHDRYYDDRYDHRYHDHYYDDSRKSRTIRNALIGAAIGAVLTH